MVGRTGTRCDSEKHSLLRATKEKRLWRVMIAHALKRHCALKDLFYMPSVLLAIMALPAVVFSTLLYACEAWTSYRRDIKFLDRFQQMMFRIIIRIIWENGLRNNDVLFWMTLLSIDATSLQCSTLGGLRVQNASHLTSAFHPVWREGPTARGYTETQNNASRISRRHTGYRPTTTLRPGKPLLHIGLTGIGPST